jgi:hypothetical protein
MSAEQEEFEKLTEEDHKWLAQLRHRGFAVIVWTPEELRDANPDHVEERSIEFGWQVIEMLQ